MELITVGDGVHAVLQGDGLGESNSGFIANGGGMVVDTFWDLPRTRELLRLYSTVAAEPPRRLVNTHHNGDHCWGNQLLVDAEIIGHRECAKRMAQEVPPAILQSLAKSAADSGEESGFAGALASFDFEGIEITPPTSVIESDTAVDLDGRTVELLYVGPSHTAGDVAVWLPDEGVLFTGDVLFNQCAPIGWEGTFENWIVALERLSALGPSVVVPGHGPVCDESGLDGLREYLVYVLAESRVHFDNGLPSFEAASRIDLSRFAGWSEHERLVFQVDRAYREFRGEPWDTPIDFMRLAGEAVQLHALLEP